LTVLILAGAKKANSLIAIEMVMISPAIPHEGRADSWSNNIMKLIIRLRRFLETVSIVMFYFASVFSTLIHITDDNVLSSGKRLEIPGLTNKS
jgi:hypothetical protein